MKIDDLAFVVNPRAGSGYAAEVWRALLAGDRDLAGARVVSAGASEEAAAAIDEALAGRPRRLVVVGGDGSLNLAANRILASGRGGEVELGLVPAGTGSDLARTLALPRRARAALARAVDGPVRPFDVLRLTTAGTVRYALNVASAGISGRVDELVNAQAKRGTAAFLTATLTALRTFRPFHAAVEVDGEPWYDGGVFLLAVANARSFGKGMRVAPRAEVDDGLADVVLVRPLPGWRVPFELPRLYLGRHLDRPAVAWRRARRVRFEPAEPLPPFDVDGETVPSGAADFELLPGALLFAG
jgi:diacylglycerol kinase (ATP)